MMLYPQGPYSDLLTVKPELLLRSNRNKRMRVFKSRNKGELKGVQRELRRRMELSRTMSVESGRALDSS